MQPTNLCVRLTQPGRQVECYWYNGQPHTFYGEGDQLFISRTIDFFNRWLRTP